jgi:hypothetical protein
VGIPGAVHFIEVEKYEDVDTTKKIVKILCT